MGDLQWVRVCKPLPSTIQHNAARKALQEKNLGTRRPEYSDVRIRCRSVDVRFKMAVREVYSPPAKQMSMIPCRRAEKGCIALCNARLDRHTDLTGCEPWQSNRQRIPAYQEDLVTEADAIQQPLQPSFYTSRHGSRRIPKLKIRHLRQQPYA